MRMINSPQDVFYYMENQRLTWSDAIAELVDNAFDAGAKQVELRFNSAERWWEVKDDGHGCADISKMAPIGSHHDQGTSKQPVGMFGIGLKDAWMFSGDSIRVETVCQGKRGVWESRREDVADDWEGPDPVYSAAPDALPGTTVHFSMKRDRRVPRQETWDRIRWFFTPALKDGCQISIASGKKGRKTVLKAIDMPLFAESVEDTFDVNGRTVSIAIGILKDGYRMTNGPFWIIYGHRIIKNSSIGAGGYGTLRMGGQIILGKGWKLTKNKDDLSAFAEELADAIFGRIEYLLKKHDQIAEEVESAALRTELEGMLNDAIRRAKKKEKRDSPSNNTGAVLPKGTGRKRKNFTKTQEGDNAEASKRKGFKITWMDDEGKGLGEYDALSRVVRLNIAHTFISDAKEQGNRPALYSVAVALMSHYLCNNDARGQPLLKELAGSFTETFAVIMQDIKGKMEDSRNGANSAPRR